MNIPVPDPETIALLQSFGYGMAQNLISSAIVEWKKLKDDKNAQENTAWLENVEHSKPLEDRVVQSVCEAHRKIDLLDAILDALGTNRPTNQVAQHFTRAIKLKLFLAPNVADAIAERVRLWKEAKLGRVGIIVPSSYRKI